MNVLGICAGVGGLELGIRIAEPGACGVIYVEREAYAAANLVARMEDGWLHPAPVWTDLGTFDPEPWRGVVHCVASGDPCQPNSVAGRGLGEDDDRWLLDQVIRIIDCLRPHRVFRENVPGNADGQLAALVPALEGMGYCVAAGIFSAAEAGASHRRERLFIMADAIGRQPTWRAAGPIGEESWRSHGQSSGSDDDVANGDSDRQPPGCGDERSQDCPWGQHGDDPERCGGDLGNAKELGRREGRTEHELWGGRHPSSGHGSQLADASSPGPQGGERCGSPGSRDRQEALGPASELCLPLFAPGPSDPVWTAIIGRAPHLEPAVCRVADGLAHRVDRLRACGNGVVPLAAAYAWRALEASLLLERGADQRVTTVKEKA